MKKAYIQTYGCQMNEHDTHRMIALLGAEGYQMATTPEEADLVLVNTCSVRHNPENKVWSQLGRLRGLKKDNPDLIIGVGGCVAQQEGENILKREKVVDMVFGPDNLFKLPEMIARVRQGERVLMTKWQPHERRVQNFIPEEWVERGHVEGCKAYVSITKGCDNFCTFCVVPYTRGREVSREADNILRESRQLVADGAKEIWLLGQNVNSYRALEFGFYELLDAISEIDGLERLRFTSPHPNDWTDALSDLMTERKTICNQLHLPFQSGSNRVLDTMHRQHTIEDYLEKIRYMRSVNPDIELSTDLIVGFPTESEEDFERTLDVVREVRFSMIFPFKYSPRPKTKAAQMDDDVPREVKEQRLARVIELQREIHEEDIQRYVGTEQEVLINSASVKERDTMSGRTDGYRPVSIRDGGLEIGDLVRARITAASGHWLYGEVLSEVEALRS
ncbi:MAG: tRNA (N6-isopentenyl adenosine(37)-C2)-methylthiotransferase MiaB [Candidatus Hydrogenedentes bacterium]|nr:tRNA (N6-isopentenyl adenosine(37)-C2)-methylthiotransferase MiaB [Candidatus Hydrogenedentota bacterium]